MAVAIEDLTKLETADVDSAYDLLDKVLKKSVLSKSADILGANESDIIEALKLVGLGVADFATQIEFQKDRLEKLKVAQSRDEIQAKIEAANCKFEPITAKLEAAQAAYDEAVAPLNRELSVLELKKSQAERAAESLERRYRPDWIQEKLKSLQTVASNFHIELKRRRREIDRKRNDKMFEERSAGKIVRSAVRDAERERFKESRDKSVTEMEASLSAVEADADEIQKQIDAVYELLDSQVLPLERKA